MKITLKSIYIFVFLLLPALTHAAANTYYVTQNGNGAKDGKSQSNAWSVSDFNSSANWSATDNSDKIDPGDTVYFSGTITTGLIPQGSGTSKNYITLDGYESDDTTYMDLSEASGRAKIDLTTSDDCIDIFGESYITIQDFEITDCNKGINLTDGSDWITVKRTYIYECGRNGIYVGDASLQLENITIGGSSGDGNVLKNIGTDTAGADIVLCRGNDVIISYNHLYANDSDWGIDGIGATCNKNSYNILIEHNSIHGHNYLTAGEDGIDLKDDSYNIIIRFNHIYDHYRNPANDSGSPTNIKLNNAQQVYIYGNLIQNAEGANVYISNRGDFDDIYLFSNIITNSEDSGFSSSSTGSDANDHYIFNNTFAENADSPDGTAHAAFKLNTKDGMVIKNNIIYKSRPNDSNHRQVYLSSSSDDNSTFDYNRYYWPGKTSKMYINGKSVNAIGGSEGIETHGSEGDPGLTDINNHGFTIAQGAAVIGAGVDMGTGAIATPIIQGVAYPVYWDVALGPNTDWSGTIPVVEVLRRDIVGWDIGAYAYKDTAEKKKPGQDPDQEQDLEKIFDTQAPMPPNAFRSES